MHMGDTMENRFGFIRENLDIKILILFILGRLPEPISYDKLTDLAMCDNGITYFAFAECLADLIATGHVEELENGYVITEKGRENGETTEFSIPYSVRIKAERRTARVAYAQRRDAMISVSREIRSRGGCMMNMSMSDDNGPVLTLGLLVGTESEANAIERCFRNSAEDLYGKIIQLCLDNSDM